MIGRIVFPAIAAALLAPLPVACSTSSPQANSQTNAEAERSILQQSRPASGSTVAGPLDRIELWFDPPARLVELTIGTSDGLTMPMMVTAVAETRFYSIPLSDLPAGSYRVRWRAVASGEEHRGSFSFQLD